MDKSQKRKKNYWGVTKWRKNLENLILFEGTYKECWDWLVTNHPNRTMKELTFHDHIKIERIG